MNAKLSERLKVVWRDFDPGGVVQTNVTSTNWLDMSGYNSLMVIAVRTVGTGDGNLILHASAAVTGTNSVAIGTSMGTTSCTGLLSSASNGSIGNPGAGMLVAEATWSEVAAAVEDGRYIGAQMEATTGTDEWAVCYIFGDARYGQAGETVTGNSL